MSCFECHLSMVNCRLVYEFYLLEFAHQIQMRRSPYPYLTLPATTQSLPTQPTNGIAHAIIYYFQQSEAYF